MCILTLSTSVQLCSIDLLSFIIFSQHTKYNKVLLPTNDSGNNNLPYLLCDNYFINPKTI
jgi:hypothetical protein